MAWPKNSGGGTLFGRRVYLMNSEWLPGQITDNRHEDTDAGRSGMRAYVAMRGAGVAENKASATVAILDQFPAHADHHLHGDLRLIRWHLVPEVGGLYAAACKWQTSEEFLDPW